MIPNRTKYPIPNRQEGLEFMKSTNKTIANIISNKTKVFISEENIKQYQHGSGFKTFYGHPYADEGENTFTQHSAEVLVKQVDLLNNNLSAFNNFINDLTEKMMSELLGTLYKKVSEATEKTGNVVSAKDHEGSATATFLEMLEKIKFGVDQNGKVSLPQIHSGDDKFLKKLEKESTPLFELKVEEIKARKTSEALKDEIERIKKFKKP